MNRTFLSFRATWRTRSRSLGTPSPAPRPGRVSLAVFPLGRPLPSPASATASAALFGGFAGTTGLSDFPWSCIKGLPPQRSPHGPPSVDLPPREPSRTGHHRLPRATTGSPGSRAWSLSYVPGIFDRAGSTSGSRKRRRRCCLPQSGQRGHPELFAFRGSKTPPARPLSTLRCGLADRQRMTRGHRRSLLLSM